MNTHATVQIFDGPGTPLRLERLPLPRSLEPGELLVEIEQATICGSDLHTLDGRRNEPFPSILGHEAVGRVAVGTRADKVGARAGIDAGERVTWSIADSCGSCPACVDHDLPEKCHALFKYGHAGLEDGSGLNGCYASHILLRAGTHVVRVGEELPAGVAAPVNCALATAVNAVSQIPDSCRAVVVQGAGLLGIYACARLRGQGVERVFCVDVQKGRLERAEAFGGIPVDGRAERYAESRRVIEQAAPRGVDAVIEVAGAAALVPEGVRLLRPGGTYVFAGMVHPDTRLELTGEQVIRKCLTIRGVHNYSPCHLDRGVAFLRETAARYPYASLVSAPFPLTALEEAAQVARSGRYLRVAVDPGEES